MSQNLSKQINQYSSLEVLNIIRIASQKARNQGQKLYLVGGIVRDLMLGKPSFDLDFSIEGGALNLARSIGEEVGQCVMNYPRFGTATIRFASIQVDIAAARTETYSHPGALPQVKPASLLEDLYRRDFTINAMAIDISASHFGDLIDPLKGEEDLKKGLIRVIHEKSFTDDSTRIFRAIRYEQRLGFKIEKQTIEWALRDRGFINNISGERIRHEMELVFGEEWPEKSLYRGEELGIWKFLNRELAAYDKLKCAFEKLRQLDLKTPYPLPLLFSLFFFPLSTNATEELIKRLNINKAIAIALRDVIRLKEVKPGLETASEDKLAFYQLLKDFSPHAVLALAIFSQEENLREALLHYYKKLRFVKTSLKGKDLVNLGFIPGPSIGEVLQKLLEARVMGQVKSKKEEVEFAKIFLAGKHFYK